MGKNSAPWLNWVVLIVGILYLVADLDIFTGFSAINWYTVAFLLYGLCGVSCSK